MTELFVTPTAAERETELLRVAAADAIPVVLVTERVAATLSDTVTPQGIVAVVQPAPVTLESVLTGARLVVVLDGVSDPGNAGTAIRTADAAGADVVILTPGSVDAYNGKCVRASAGSVFTVPVVAGPDAEAVIDLVQGAGLSVFATVLTGDDDLDDLADSDALTGPTAWLFGGEARGLDGVVSTRADRRVRIPMYGGAESLNLAASVAICLFASARAQRRSAQ